MRFGDAMFASLQQLLQLAGVAHDITTTQQMGDKACHSHSAWHAPSVEEQVSSVVPMQLGMTIKARRAQVPNTLPSVALEDNTSPALVRSITLDTGAIGTVGRKNGGEPVKPFGN